MVSNSAKFTYIDPITKEQLLLKGFRYNKRCSNDNFDIYTYRFPVYKHKSYVLLDCELEAAPGNNIVDINVYTHNTNDIYPHFYYNEYGNYDSVLKEIYRSIEKTLNKLKISWRR